MVKLPGISSDQTETEEKGGRNTLWSLCIVSYTNIPLMNTLINYGPKKS